MTNILEDGENIEVNLCLPQPSTNGNNGHDVYSSTGLAESVDHDQAVLPPQTPSISKDYNRTRSRMTFPFGQSKNVTPEAAATLSTTSPETRGTDEEMSFRKGRERHQALLFEEEEPGLLPSEVDSDEQSLVEAETAETLLGSALRMAEDETGGNVLSMVSSSRLEAIDLGRRVSTFSGIRGANGVIRSPSLLPDDGSAHTWNSHATETTFIKVDPANITQEIWGEIIGVSITVGGVDGDMDGELDGDMDDSPIGNVTMKDYLMRAIPIDDELQVRSKSPPGTTRVVNYAVQEVLGPSKDRKWDKLRNTLEAQERRASVGCELEFDSNRNEKSGSPQRIKHLGKEFQSLVCQKRTSKLLAAKSVAPDLSSESVEALSSMQSAPSNLVDTSVEKSTQIYMVPKQRADQPTQLSDKPNQRVKRSKKWFHKPRKSVEKPFDVNIQVEDLSMKRYDRNLNASSDPTFGSHDDVLENPEEAESMEVVYSGDQTRDTLPPFPTKLVGKCI